MEIEYNMDLDAIAVKYKEKVGLATAPAPGAAKRPTKRAVGASSAGGGASEATREDGFGADEEEEEEAVARMSEHQQKRFRMAQETASQNRQIREATLKLATRGPGDPEADAAAAKHRAAVLARMPSEAMLEKRKVVDEATAEVLQGMVKRQKEADAERQRLATLTVRLADRMLTFRAQASRLTAVCACRQQRSSPRRCASSR